ncbi:hypothetical protein ABZX77_51825, partial [Streptomyces sp. NPDC004237]|uniref:hypothetical protein n=1 Tax=Streptomyces sp. NPDC004237 TaxID=3154455 RepID=UPI00339F1AEE
MTDTGEGRVHAGGPAERTSDPRPFEDMPGLRQRERVRAQPGDDEGGVEKNEEGHAPGGRE